MVQLTKISECYKLKLKQPCRSIQGLTWIQAAEHIPWRWMGSGLGRVSWQVGVPGPSAAGHDASPVLPQAMMNGDTDPAKMSKKHKCIWHFYQSMRNFLASLEQIWKNVNMYRTCCLVSAYLTYESLNHTLSHCSLHLHIILTNCIILKNYSSWLISLF